MRSCEDMPVFMIFSGMSNEDKESGLILNAKDEKDKLSSKMGQKEEKVERKIDKEVVEDKDGGGIPYKVKAGAFLAFAGGFGLLAGFGGALAQANTFDQSCRYLSRLGR